ncbi:MAG TPA: hypothetical protein VFI48_06065 [Hyphomicrobiaceae bacterium]|nr:hypothetical protein [Hyphomicrobiaceae bacterium]
MPRSIKRPSLGQIVWYYPSVPPTVPSAAIVVNQATRTTFGLSIFDRAAGTVSYVAAVPYHDGTRPTTGAWCTHVRINEPATGVWPSDK